MEPDRHDAPPAGSTTQADLRALARLRDRVEAAVHEITRLREENKALAARVAVLQEEAPSGGGDTHLALFPEAEDADTIKARIQGFIDMLDQLLAPAEPDAPASDTA